MRYWSLLTVILVFACKSSAVQPVGIDSPSSAHFLLSDVMQNDCAGQLSKLGSYHYLFVPNEYYDEEKDPRLKKFREYRVLSSVNINTQKVESINLNCLVGLTIPELNDLFGLELCSRNPVFPDWDEARFIFGGLCDRVYVELREGAVVEVVKAGIVSH